MKILPPVSIEARRLLPSRWDLLAAILVLGFIVAFADASRFLVHPLSSITGHDLYLNLSDLPGYALRTALRMLIAMGVSLAFTFTYATWAAKNPRAGILLVPLLDRRIEEISPIEHAVMWIAAYEFSLCLEIPWRVVLNESIELAKEFGGTDGHKYVNGVLNKLAPRLRATEVAADRAAPRERG